MILLVAAIGLAVVAFAETAYVNDLVPYDNLTENEFWNTKGHKPVAVSRVASSVVTIDLGRRAAVADLNPFESRYRTRGNAPLDVFKSTEPTGHLLIIR